jgi:4-amino-4-deoxy-L-arabinose transferase-like glycosyltransferase
MAQRVYLRASFAALYRWGRPSPINLLLSHDVAGGLSALDDFRCPAVDRALALSPRLKDISSQLCLCWFVAIFVFFSLSSTKRDLYLLPLLPTLALVVACYMNSLISECGADEASCRWITVSFFAMLALGAILVPAAAGISEPMLSCRCCQRVWCLR